MSPIYPNHYRLAIIQFQLVQLENLLKTAQEGILATGRLIDYIDYYQTELHAAGVLGPFNQALLVVFNLRNQIITTLNSIEQR